MTKLSIVIPVYQVKPYLKRCLDSILSQTFTDFEVILVDDGSSDGSQDICDDYGEKNNNFIVIHKQNGGLSSARNVGIDAATGEYVMFVDSDDLIHSKISEYGINILEECSADIFICPLKRFETEDEIDVYSDIKDPDNISVITGIETEKKLFNNPNANMFVSACGKIFRRSLFEGIRFPEGRLFEDEFTTYKLYDKSSNVIVSDTELYFYFVNKDGITRNLSLNKRFDEYDAQEERIEYYKNKGHTELYHLALMEYLRTAQWDLISCQERKEEYDSDKGSAFQSQYTNMLAQAEKEGIVSFVDNYDYYVLAYPKKKKGLRLKRIYLKAIGKMN